MDRKQCVGEPWEDFRWSSEEEQQQPIPLQAAASCREGAGAAGTFSFPKPGQLQPSHAAGSWDEGSPGASPPSIRPGRWPARPQPESRRERQQRGLRQERRAALVVCLCWMDTGDRNQRCVWILHHDVRADVRERTLHKLAHLNGGLLLWEPLYYPTPEGEVT